MQFLCIHDLQEYSFHIYKSADFAQDILLKLWCKLAILLCNACDFSLVVLVTNSDINVTDQKRKTIILTLAAAAARHRQLDIGM